VSATEIALIIGAANTTTGQHHDEHPTNKLVTNLQHRITGWFKQSQG